MMTTKNTGALRKVEGDSDYELKENHGSCWVTVDNISVYIVRNDEGVSVDLYPHFCENNEALGSTSVTFAAADALL